VRILDTSRINPAFSIGSDNGAVQDASAESCLKVVDQEWRRIASWWTRELDDDRQAYDHAWDSCRWLLRTVKLNNSTCRMGEPLWMKNKVRE
jgi:hypothetical protein